MTTALPARSAGIASPSARLRGAFHGLMIPITPRGLKTTRPRLPRSGRVLTRRGASQRGARRASQPRSMHTPISSPTTSKRALPVSRSSRSRMAARSRTSSRRARLSRRVRSRGERAAHAGCAARPRATAAATAAPSSTASSATTVPRAGSHTVRRIPPSPGWFAPIAIVAPPEPMIASDPVRRRWLRAVGLMFHFPDDGRRLHPSDPAARPPPSPTPFGVELTVGQTVHFHPDCGQAVRFHRPSMLLSTPTSFHR